MLNGNYIISISELPEKNQFVLYDYFQVDFRSPPRCPGGKIRMTMRYPGGGSNGVSSQSDRQLAQDRIPFSTIVNNNIWIKKRADLNIRVSESYNSFLFFGKKLI